MSDHSAWCDTCAVAHGGPHRGMLRQVRDDRRRPLAGVWLEQLPDGPVSVGFSARPCAVWTVEQAGLVAAAVAEVVEVAGRVRV